MPAEQGYERRVGGGSAQAPVTAGADAFGAGVGDSIARLGGALHQVKLEEYRIERERKADAEASDFAAKFAALRLEADVASADARNNAAPGGAGHIEAISAWYQKQREGLLEGITEDRIRQHAQEQLDTFGASFAGREYEWQAGARAGKIVTDTGATIDTAANRARSNGTAYKEELTALLGSIEALKGVPADVRDKLHREAEQSVTVGLLNGMQDRGELVQAQALLDSGAFDAILTPEQIDQARNGVAIEQRRMAAQADHLAAVTKAEVAERTATLSARIEAGDVPTDAELEKAAADASAIGDASGAVRLTAARIQTALNRSTQPWTPDQYRQGIDELEAKGAKRSAGENIALAQLKRIAPGRIAAFNADPGSWAALNGKPRPALSLSDPASIAANAEWRASVEKVAGRAPAILSDEMRRDFAATLAEGPAGYVEIANQLAALGGRDGQRAAHQVAPNDAMLARLVVINPADRPAVVNGAAARKAHPQLVDGQAGNDARVTFDAYVGGALALMAQQDVAATFEATRNIFADAAVKRGRTVGEGDVDRQIEAAAHRALGGTRGVDGQAGGGIGEWNGAKVLLPAARTQGAFDRAMTAMTWPDEAPHAPVWNNGAPMTPAELRKFTPVARPDGWYEFHNARGEVVQAKSGGIFRLDIARLAGPH